LITAVEFFKNTAQQLDNKMSFKCYLSYLITWSLYVWALVNLLFFGTFEIAKIFWQSDMEQTRM